MVKQSIFDKVREWLGGIAFDVFLWSIRMTQDDYLDSVVRENEQTQDEQDGACALCGGEVVDRVPGFCKQCRVQDPPRLNPNC